MTGRSRKKVEAAEALLPRPGSVWIWEPDEPHARDRVRVTETFWNGEEWWVVSVNDDQRYCTNTFDRWIEAAVLEKGAET